MTEQREEKKQNQKRQQQQKKKIEKVAEKQKVTKRGKKEMNGFSLMLTDGHTDGRTHPHVEMRGHI